MNHTLITMAALGVATFFGTQWWVLVIMAGFWASREYSQAEYCWLSIHKANRSRGMQGSCLSAGTGMVC